MLKLGLPCWSGVVASNAWAHPDAVWAADFKNNRYAQQGGAGSLADLVSVTRSSKAWLYSGSTWIEFLANVVARINGIGMFVGGQFINKIRNPRGEGGTIGVIGSGGSMPTNWNAGNFGAGVSVELVGTGEVDGLAYVDFRIFGTNTVGFTRQYQFYMEANTYAAAVAGQAWGAMVGIKKVSGDFSVSSGCTFSMQYLTAAQSGVSGGTFSVSNNWAADDVVSYVAKGIAPATAAYVRSIVEVNNVANGASIDITLRIYSPKLAQITVAEGTAGHMPSYPILPPVGVPGDSSKLADDVRASAFDWFTASGLAAGAAHLVVPNLTFVAGGAWRYLFEYSDGTLDNRIAGYVGSDDKPVLKIVVAGDTLATLIHPTALTAGRKPLVFGWGPDGLYITNGAVTESLDAVTLPTVTQMRLAGAVAAVNFLNDFIEQVQVCSPMSEAAAAALAVAA